jgi:predicted nuclease of predicted toxin-antitoxin system
VRFVLDENLDRAVGVVLRQAGHDCWAVGGAGLSGAIDDAIAVHPDERKAVLVSHDRAFAERLLASMPNVVIEVAVDQVIHPPRWR